MNRSIITLVYIVAIIILFCVIVKNASFTDKNNMDTNDHSSLYDNKVIQYMEAVEYSVDTCQILLCHNDSLNSMAMISKQPRIGLYIDARQCTPCWKKELKQLAIWDDSLSFDNTPIIIANNFNMREIKIMQESTKFPIYSIGNILNFLPSLTKFNSPFFFVIDKGSISRPFFPSEEDPNSLSLKYLKHIDAVLKKKDSENNLGDSISLIVQNPIVDLGKVRTREKSTIQYSLHNNMIEPCMIYKCVPSCSCIIVDSFSTVIPAGEDGYVCVSTSQINKGDFHYSINLQTSIQNQPYTVEFSGYCE